MSQLILDGHKLAWHRERVEALLNGERVAPITIDCALTRQCNYRCVYCYGQLQQNHGHELSRDHIIRFLDDAATVGVKAISFVSDGESACSPHLYEAVSHGRRNGLDMALGTNGYLLREDKLPELLQGLTYLRFNISAGEPQRYGEIHGCSPKCFDRVTGTIKTCVAIKRRYQLPVTIGLQMVLMPEFENQILPLARLGRDLGVDYLVIKHCSDDEEGSLGVDYDGYERLYATLHEAESCSTDCYHVQAKWSKIKTKGKRSYRRCYGPPLIMQFSGSGLVAPCGMLFNERYKKFHIGNIAEQSFRDIWQSQRYWDVMSLIRSDNFDARTMCGSLCLQHKVNECLSSIAENGAALSAPDTNQQPMHINFI